VIRGWPGIQHACAVTPKNDVVEPGSGHCAPLDPGRLTNTRLDPNLGTSSGR
jgi:hypothetical protein